VSIIILYVGTDRACQFLLAQFAVRDYSIGNCRILLELVRKIITNYDKLYFMVLISQVGIPKSNTGHERVLLRNGEIRNNEMYIMCRRER